MCSQTQPKMFGGAMPLGNGGNMPLPTTYQANAQPTADVSSAPPAPTPTPVNGAPATTAQNNPVGSNMWKMNTYKRWGQQMGGGGGPWGGGRMGTLPPMKPGGPNMMG